MPEQWVLNSETDKGGLKQMGEAKKAEHTEADERINYLLDIVRAASVGQQGGEVETAWAAYLGGVPDEIVSSLGMANVESKVRANFAPYMKGEPLDVEEAKKLNAKIMDQLATAAQFKKKAA
jgi:hypothetical protein